MNITIRQLQAFIEVADAASFTHAAKRMHIAQPALSQHVRDLESELGIRLFDRTTRRVELTEGGREFRNPAGKIVEDLDHATRHVHDYAQRNTGGSRSPPRRCSRQRFCPGRSRTFAPLFLASRSA